MASKKSKQEYTDLDQELDIEEFKESVLNFFGRIPDPRLSCNQTYKLEHIFFIILSAVLAGANSLNQIVIFSKSKAHWLKRFIAIDKTPSYGVFWWVLVRTKPEFLRQLLLAWLLGLPAELRDQILAIDGKHLRGTQGKVTPFLHLVSLFVANTGIVLAHHPVETKSNEIKAIPKVLEGFDVSGAIITTDAMGCQKSIVKKICDKNADYVLALKSNAGLIYDEVINYFEQAEQVEYEGVSHTSFSYEEIKHGRKVLRKVTYVEDLEWLPQAGKWVNLKGLVEVFSQRTENGKTSSERRYYITSLSRSAEGMARIIQDHWKIENNLHRQLDVNFVEDASTINTGYAAENLAIFRRLALNILGSGKGLLERRKRVAWEEEYLTNLVMKFFIKSF